MSVNSLERWFVDGSTDAAPGHVPRRALPGLAARVRVARFKLELTQVELAERAKLSTQTVIRLEIDSRASTMVLRRLAPVLGLTFDQISGRKP